MQLPINIDQIRGWVTEAGAIARRYFGHVEAEWKAADSPVTVADREIEQMLTGQIRAAHPDHGILGEEFGGADLDREFLWAIDPIDGTRAFVEGLPSWSISVALLHQLAPVFGLVHIPLYDDWTYTDGDNVFHNGVSLRGCLSTRWGPNSYVWWRSDARTIYDLRFRRAMTLGTTASHMAYTARGAGIAALVNDSYVWDMAAGAAFMAKLGGELRWLNGSPGGEPLNFGSIPLTQPVEGMVIAAHPDIARRLAPLIVPRSDEYTHPDW